MIRMVKGKDFFSAPHSRAVWLALRLVIFFAPPVRPNYPANEDIYLRILRAEDERRCDDALLALLSHQNVEVRQRAALAAGRIGDDVAVRPLTTLLANDSDPNVRAMAAFALGEIESSAGVEALTNALHRDAETAPVRARAVEALGKIAAANLAADKQATDSQASMAAIVGEIERVLRHDGQAGEREVLLAALTAALRARMINAGPTIAVLLKHTDARVRADTANTLARLRVKSVNTQVEAALNDADPVVRSNVAQALGRAEDHAVFDNLLRLMQTDTDARVRISSEQALANLQEARAMQPLLEHAKELLQEAAAQPRTLRHPAQVNELLIIATTLGRLGAAPNRGQAARSQAITFLKNFRVIERGQAPEIEIALARLEPAQYVQQVSSTQFTDWQSVSALAQGLGEIAALKQITDGDLTATRNRATGHLLKLIKAPATPPLAMPDVLRAFAAFKSADAGPVLTSQLGARDVIVRATAAELLGELPSSPEITKSLQASLTSALRDSMNDAALSILDSLAKQKSATANEAIKSALDATDHLLRRRAVTLLKANNAGDLSSKIGTVRTVNRLVDYRRAINRAGRTVQAQVFTDKGSFIIELLPRDAPLTVDSFVRLARRGFFDNLTFHRVVPNFVIQGGDPRGDGNGGPGYQIRCEVNEVPYERGAVGMALSGKDTGGSQWFVTHAPQPHLDGGYTVFGRVTKGMEVVDAIARGDRIRRVVISEKMARTNH